MEQPKTIDELKAWYEEKGLPDENITRFFIGKDTYEPKAYGIYYDPYFAEYVVYKVKDTGERVIRYQGPDEETAVREIYLKLVEKIAQHNARLSDKENAVISRQNGNSYINYRTKKQIISFFVVLAMFFIFFLYQMISRFHNSVDVYYDGGYYDDGYYYYYDDDYYDDDYYYYDDDYDYDDYDYDDWDYDWDDDWDYDDWGDDW